MPFSARSARNMAWLLVVTRGIGTGVIVGGALHRGHRKAAGEVGYLLPGVECLVLASASEQLVVKRLP